MAKRIFSMILASMLLIGTLTVVSASVQPTTLTDNFEGQEAGNISLSTGYTSDVWTMTNAQAQNVTAFTGDFGTAEKPKIQMQIETIDRNSVMKLTTKPSAASGVASKAMAFADAAYDTVYTSFDFMVPADGKNGSFYIGARTSNSYTYTYLISVANSTMTKFKDNGWDTTGQESFTFTRGAWYKAVLKVTSTSAHVIIYDANGVQKLEKERTGLSLAYSQLGLVIPSASTNSDYSMYLDNSKIVTVNSASDTVEVLSDSMTDKTDVATSTNTVDVTFDQPVDPDASVVTLTGGAAPITCTATAVGSDTLRVSWEDALVMNTQYTLDCSGVKGWAGNNAAADAAVSFTTTARNPLTLDYKDDFTNATVGAYSLANGGYTSDVWTMTANVGYSLAYVINNDNIIAIEAVEESGNKAMKLTQKTGNGGFVTPLRELSPYDEMNFSFKFKLPASNGNAPGGWNFGVFQGAGTAKHLVRVSPQGDVYQLDAANYPINGKKIDVDEWHTVFMKSSANQASVYIYDAEGNVVFKEENKQHNGNFTQIRFFIYAPGITVRENSILLDDSRVFAYTAENSLTYEGEATVANVNPFKGYVDLKFDLPVNVPSSVQLTSAADSKVGSTRITLTKASYDTLRVSFAALNESTSYTLNFAGVKGLANNALYGTNEITFTTAAAEGVKGTNGNTVIGADGAVGDSVNVIIGNYEATDVDADVLVALYSSDTTLAGVEPVVDPLIMPGQNNITLPLSKTYTGITKIKVIMLDNMTNLKPIMECIEIQ